jgi:DNA-binding GntR family transcriptional regulator
MRDKILTPGAIAEYNAQHRALYKALTSRDVDRAVAIIVEHLEKAGRDLLGAGNG